MLIGFHLREPARRLRGVLDRVVGLGLTVLPQPRRLLNPGFQAAPGLRFDRWMPLPVVGTVLLPAVPHTGNAIAGTE